MRRPAMKMQTANHTIARRNEKLVAFVLPLALALLVVSQFVVV
jgi:hypothetical protein